MTKRYFGEATLSSAKKIFGIRMDPVFSEENAFAIRFHENNIFTSMSTSVADDLMVMIMEGAKRKCIFCSK